MAKIILENLREHEITIAGLDDSGELVQVIVPASRQNPNVPDEIVVGSAEADDTFVEAMRKKPVVASYFDQDWLRIAASPDADAKADAKAKKSDAKA